MKVFYQSAVRGQANPNKEKEVLYYGKIYRIPRILAAQKDLTIATDLEKLMIEGIMVERPDCEPVPDGPIERHEVFDKDTGDICVMWRVPYQGKQLKTSTGPTPTTQGQT